ncbi:MAG: hypothetical protein RIT45_32 [Pseudomonadota bacterium]|jgi:ribonuclease E
MKRMLISVDLEESRAAVVEDGKLTHLEIEPVARDTCKGNIYRGVVARVEPSLQSAFVDFGRDKQGFLPVGEIHPLLRPDGADKRAPIQELIKAGQQIVVQVQRDEIGQKGATLSTFVSLPGRYLVLMPESDKTGVSRKLSDSARERVKELTDTMKVPDGFGLIVRTAGETATKLELSKDLVYLSRLWEHIQEQSQKGRGPTLLYQERSLAIRFVRDYYRRDIEEIVIDDDDAADEVGAYLSVLMPKNLSCIERYSGTVPLFARYGVQSQVEDVFSRQVPLPSGGSIVIDQTEALVAVDVNSGRVKGKDIEDTALQTNIEAAQEVARQLVLRDLGGLVVVDFIDMRDRKSVREVENALKNAMKLDKARHKIGRISEFGLMELSRQRLKSSVNKGAFESCGHCSGTGFSRTTPSVAASVLRRIYELVGKGGVSYVIAQVPPEAASFLLNNKRRELSEIERQYHVSIEIVAVEGMNGTQVTIEHLSKVPEKSGAERLKVARFDRVAQQLDLVRNRLLNMEETRIERQLAKRLSGARIDYAEVYADVGESTADVRAEETAARKAAADAAAARAAAMPKPRPAPAAPTPAALDEDLEPPRPQGFFGWLGGLFGMGKPAPTADMSVLDEPAFASASLPEPEPESAPAPAPRTAPAAAASDDDEDGEGRRRNKRRRGGRRRRRDEDDAGDDAQAARSEDRDGDDDSDDDGEGREAAHSSEDGEDSDGRRRRRRGGRRRRKGRDEDGARDEGSEGDDAVAAEGGDDAESADAKADDDGAQAGSDESEGRSSRGRRRRRRGRRDDSGASEVDGDESSAEASTDEVADEAEIALAGAADAVADTSESADGAEAADAASEPVDGVAAEASADGEASEADASNGVEAAADSADETTAVDAAAEGDVPAEDAGVAAEADGDADGEANGEAVEAAAAEVELTDVGALVEAEIARLTEAGLAAPEPTEGEPEEVAPLAPKSRFVVDLRSNGGNG